jgi:hypothetical protein
MPNAKINNFRLFSRPHGITPGTRWGENAPAVPAGFGP